MREREREGVRGTSEGDGGEGRGREGVAIQGIVNSGNESRPAVLAVVVMKFILSAFVSSSTRVFSLFVFFYLTRY